MSVTENTAILDSVQVVLIHPDGTRTIMHGDAGCAEPEQDSDDDGRADG